MHKLFNRSTLKEFKDYHTTQCPGTDYRIGLKPAWARSFTTVIMRFYRISWIWPCYLSLRFLLNTDYSNLNITGRDSIVILLERSRSTALTPLYNSFQHSHYGALFTLHIACKKKIRWHSPLHNLYINRSWLYFHSGCSRWHKKYPVS